jgi:DNA-binding NarL/FixJ family response regulator
MSLMTHRVLLVDDEPALLGALRRVVERACPMAVVVYASDAQTAIWQLETTAIRLVVTDLTMHGNVLAGLSVVRAAKAAGVPVAIITGTEDAGLLAEIVEAAVPVMLKRTMSSEKLAALVAETFAA